MERLRQQDLQALLEFLGGIYAIRDLQAFPAHTVSALSKVVRSDITSYNEVNPPRKRIAWVDHPSHVLGGQEEPFKRHMAEHPLIAHYRRTRDGQALKISDFLTRSRFQRLGLYNEFYRRLDVEHQMAFTLPAPWPLVIGIALNRGRQDFSERERLLLNLLRPHLVQAYRNAEAVSQMAQDQALIGQGLETLGRAAMVVTRDGRIRQETARARQWLGEYFRGRARRMDHLPEAVWRWVRHQEAMLASQDDVPPAREPLVLEREGKRLVVRLLSGPTQSLLLFEEKQTALEPAAFERLGLTRREAEVLAWVAQGKTNAEIGTILGARPRTVAKHLERIYQKLGIENRTAAAALALTSGPAA
jgi:DNA-binding CsgD family transcriptional regulator